MKKANVKLNYLYNLAFQLFALVTPLITTPYVARVLTSGGTGKYTFAASLNSYFVMAAALGFSFHAQRAIAKKQGDIESQSAIFWEIVICKISSGAISLAALWILILCGTFGEYTTLMQIMSIEVFSTSINIAFFFQGNEKFGLIAARDFIVKIIGIILIFCFVRTQNDLWIYALCHTGSALVSVLTLWPCVRKLIVPVKLHQLRPLKHVGPSLTLFIPTIAISIFTILDKTLIGILIPGQVEVYLKDGTVVQQKIADIENGYYGQSEKIIKMAMTVLASLGTVMMPRNAKEIEDGREDVFLNNIRKAIQFVFFIGAPITCGILAVASNFAPWFFGPGYEKVPTLMMIFAFMVIPSGLGNVLGQQCLIPKGEDKKYTIAYVSTAVINLCLNILLIPQYFSLGAAVASVIAEMFAPFLMLIYLRKTINAKNIFADNWKPILAAICMYLFVHATSCLMSSSIVNTFILVAEGCVVYLAVVLLLKTSIAYEAINIVKRKILKQKSNKR